MAIIKVHAKVRQLSKYSYYGLIPAAFIKANGIKNGDAMEVTFHTNGSNPDAAVQMKILKKKPQEN